MDMSDWFSIHRFGALALKHYTEHRKSYMWNWIGLLCYCMWLNRGAFSELEQPVNEGWGIMFGLMVQLFISFNRSMKPYIGKFPKVFTSWTLPASMQEKFIFAWLDSSWGGLFMGVLSYLVVYSVGSFLPGFHGDGCMSADSFLGTWWWAVLYGYFISHAILVVNTITPYSIVILVFVYWVGRFCNLEEILSTPVWVYIVVWMVLVLLPVWGYGMFRKRQL